MHDYRENPQDSPKVWCISCRKLVVVHDCHVIMKTVFAVTSSGVYPYAVFRPCPSSTEVAQDV